MKNVSKKSILLVEDDAIIALEEKGVLESHGYAVTTASSGARALEAIAKNHKVDLILMDIDLGEGIDGTQAAEAILENHDIPIIFLSAHTEFEVVERTEGISSYGYIVKNSGETVLIASIKMAFRLFEARLKEKEKEEALNRMQILLRSSIESPKDIVILSIDKDFNYLYFNSTYREMVLTKVGTEIKAGDNLLRCIPNDEFLEESIRYYRRAFEGESIRVVEQLDNEGFYSETSYNPIRDADGLIIGASVFSIDVSERHRAETALAKSYRELASHQSELQRQNDELKRIQAELDNSRDRYFELYDRAPIGYMTVDEAGRVTEANLHAARLLGYSRDTLIGRPIESLVENRSRHDHSLVLSRPQDGEEFRSLELRMLRDDGSCFWAQLDTAMEVKGDKETACRIVMRDIDARKEAEKSLLDSEQRYYYMFENNPQPMLIYDLETLRFLQVNKAMVEKYGYSEKEFLSMTLKDIRPPEDIARLLADVEKAKKGTNPGGEWRHLKRSGEHIDVELVACSITFNNMPARHVMVNDVTERKRAEDRLHKVNDCMLSFGFDSIENINSLTRLCGEVLNATAAFYNRLNEGRLCAWGAWKAPEGLELETEPEGHICFDVISDAANDVVIVRDLQRSVYARTDPSVRRFSLETYVGKAVGVGGKSVGSICAVFQRGFEPTENDKSFIGIIASAIGVEEVRNQAERKIVSYLKEKELLLKETHHRIKNNMNTMLSLLSIQARSQPLPEVREKLEAASGRLRSMMVLYDKLYRSEHYNELNVQDFLPQLVKEIVAVFHSEPVVRTELNIGDFIVSAKILSPIGTIINEMITNSMKYAFADKDDRLIAVDASISGETATIAYMDNGIGLPDSITLENSTGFGIQLIAMLVEQIDGTVRLERGAGLRYVIEFKVHDASR